MPSQSPSAVNNGANEIRLHLTALSNAVREMIPAGALPIPAAPSRFNLLARPWKNTCRMCNLPGHASDSVTNAPACRVAILSVVDFWSDMVEHIAYLYQESDRFQKVIKGNKVTYDMRLEGSPKIGGSMEEVVVHALVKNYMRFQGHWAGIRPKAVKILRDGDVKHYQRVTATLNSFLLDGYTLSELFEKSFAKQQ